MTSRLASLQSDLAKAKDQHRPRKPIQREMQDICHRSLFSSLPAQKQERLMRKWGIIHV